MSGVDRHASVDLAFITDAASKIVKIATYCAYNGLPWGATTPRLTFLESSRRADVKF